MKKCNKCLVEKPLDFFEKMSKNSYRNICKQCKNARDHKRRKKNGVYERRKETQRLKRHDINLRHIWVYYDSNLADNKKGFSNNLTKEIVKNIIEKGCTYCGIPFENDQKIKIGLDRIDNNKPHNKENVVACCSRCNFIRRNIPYDAWILIASSVRQAVNEGLLDDWEWGFKHHHNKLN